MVPRLRAAGTLLLALLLAGCQGSGAGTSASSSAAGPSAIVPLDEQARLFIDGGAVSAVVQVAWPGGRWSKAYGLRSLDTKDPAQAGDRVSVGSVTETLTAVAVLRLVDDRLIGLDDPVNNLIPGFEAELHPPGPVTVRELLGQTSGIPSHIPATNGEDPAAVAQPVPLEQALRDAGRRPRPASSVGTYQWDETNYLALGLLVQTLRKKPFTDAVEEEIIAPLGLAHTSLTRIDLSQKDILHTYMTAHGQRIDTTDNIHTAGSPSEGLTSTMGDVNAFLAALFGSKLISPSSLAQMEKGTGPAPYALGIAKGPPGCTATGSFHTAGDQGHAITAAVSSSDGRYTAAMALVPQPLPGPPEDPNADRQRNTITEQMYWVSAWLK
jgi:D-alanyl-D-alanine carboxypeptidase